MSGNYFAYPSAAERYARSRPNFHPLVIERLRDYLAIQEKVALAGDVGCGTGQSSRALTALAQVVNGVDPSGDMLMSAEPHDDVLYTQAAAERLPFCDECFDLLTVSLAFHWFDRVRFCTEAFRLLKPGGWLVIYNNGFRGQMTENSAFQHWMHDVYIPRYPSPPRSDTPFTDADAYEFGFSFAARETYSNKISFSPETLAAYMTTQSNVIAAVEQGTEQLDDVFDWLMNESAPLFPADEATFMFGGYIWYLHKPAA
jgi:SAM-dependent methyltransferase